MAGFGTEQVFEELILLKPNTVMDDTQFNGD